MFDSTCIIKINRQQLTEEKFTMFIKNRFVNRELKLIMRS